MFGGYCWSVRSPSTTFLLYFCSFLRKNNNYIYFQVLNDILRYSWELLQLVYSCPAAVFCSTLQHCTLWAYWQSCLISTIKTLSRTFFTITCLQKLFSTPSSCLFPGCLLWNRCCYPSAACRHFQLLHVKKRNQKK